MRATVKLRELTSDRKHSIVRNLSRILDIRILDVDIESKTISLAFDNSLALEKTKRELWRIGFSVVKCIYQEPVEMTVTIDYEKHTVLY